MSESRACGPAASGRDWIDGPVLVHVGLQKTGTSWLQDHYFPFPAHGFWVPDVGSFSRKHDRRPIKTIGQWLVADENGWNWGYDAFNADRVREALRSIENPDRLLPVISNERLAGHPLSDAYDRVPIAMRIRTVFPQARILVTVREQSSIVLSSYMQYLRYGGWHTPEVYLDMPSDSRLPKLSLNFWKYDILYDTYAQIFGSDRVLLVTQEELRTDPERFIGRIAGFAGVDPPQNLPFGRESNPRRPHASAYHLRGLAYLARKSSANNWRPGVFSRSVDRTLVRSLKSAFDTVMPRRYEERLQQTLKDRIDTAIGDTFQEGNRRLQAKVPFDLKSFGYRL